MLNKRKKTWAGRVVAAVLLVALLCPSAMAAYQAPSSGYSMTEEDDNVLKVAAFRAAQVSAEILGANLVATTNIGSAGTITNTSANAAMGIFGSDINDNPDPYMYNFFYNYDQFDITSTDGTQEATWTATPYTIAGDLLYGLNQVGPVSTDTEVVTISIGGVTKTTLMSFYHEADIVVGSGDAEAYADNLAAYQSTYNEDYDPTFVSYVPSAGGTLLAQRENLIDMAIAYEEVMEATGKTTRYEDSPYVIATDYDKYVGGILSYVNKQIDSGALEEQVVAISPTYDEDTQMWAITAPGATQRVTQYFEDISLDLYYDVLGGNGENEFSLTSAQLAEYTDVVYSTNMDVTGIMQQDGVATADMPRVFDTLPTCIYGMTMNTHENGMGIPYMAAYLYYDQDPNLNPANLIAYFAENFYHVSDNSALANVVAEMLQTASVPAGASASLSGYTREAVESLIIEGIEYAAETDSDWTPDMTVGIGSQDGNGGDISFSDVTGDWYYDSVMYAARNGIISGYDDGTFQPDRDITRAEFLTLIYNYEDVGETGFAETANSAFSDIDGDWHAEAIGWAVESDIVNGYPDGTFQPDRTITREEMVTMLYNYLTPGDDSDSATAYAFPDWPDVSEYAQTAMIWGTAENVVNGVDTGDGDYLLPQGGATRAQAATLLVNYILAE